MTGEGPSRREKLEAMLEADPTDPFLHYAIAKEFVSEGNRAEGIQRLQSMLTNFPDYVPAYFQQGQLLAEAGEEENAKEILQQGIVVATRVGDQHALGEMTEFLESL